MIELVLLAYLKSTLDLPVYMEMPADPPSKFVVLERTGGSQENFIKRAMIAVQSYADTKYNAAMLNESVKEALIGNGETSLGIIDTQDVSRCELNSDYEYPDTTTKKYRYQAVFDLVY